MGNEYGKREKGDEGDKKEWSGRESMRVDDGRGLLCRTQLEPTGERFDRLEISIFCLLSSSHRLYLQFLESWHEQN